MALKLTDLIDSASLQEIQDGFAEVTGMAALTTDAQGNPVTKGSNFTDFCMKYTRQSKKGCERCGECDKKGGEKTHLTGMAAAYPCHAGLMDFAAPILVNGEFIGSFIGGQVLTEEPDESKFRRIARDLGINEDEYIEALKKVKIVPKEKVESAANFLHTIAKSISSIAYARYAESNSKITIPEDKKAAAEIFRKVEEIANKSSHVAEAVEEKFCDLARLSDECVTEINATSDTVKKIQDNAMNTRILGFNASIEASRAKESGKGFGVIAQEVRGLADTSKASADKIEKKINTISGCAKRIDECTNDMRTIIDVIIKDLEELKTVVESNK